MAMSDHSVAWFLLEESRLAGDYHYLLSSPESEQEASNLYWEDQKQLLAQRNARRLNGNEKDNERS